MNKLDNFEPTLNSIDDYNGNESKEKKIIVRNVVILCLLIGAVIAYFKLTSMPSDYIGTPEQPGITVSR